MKKKYESPELLLTYSDEKDVITTSGGDTPYLNAFDW